MDEALILSRVQFGLNIGFHILFPAITIGLAWLLVHFRIRYERTRDPAWLQTYRLWVKVFALSFAMGVVSGVVMSFQFGTNWPGYMNVVGNIAGPLLAYEVLTAFFLEATFLGVMLFGMNRVSGRVHLLSSVVVAAGTTLSAFWILALNSWMQTPVGFEMIDGMAHPTDWLAILFAPSFPYRFTHMMLASGLTASFMIAGISAYRWLRGDQAGSVVAALRSSVYAAAVLIPIQITVGDLHGLNTLEYQPAKIAAMEGIWEDTRGAPVLLFAIPDSENRTNRFEVGIPKLASLILTHSLDGEIKGLDSFPDEHPPVGPVFWSFRVMVGVGALMLVFSWTAAWQMRRAAAPKPWVLRALVWMTFAGWVATVAGWYVTEIGRQPWLVYGVMRTSEAVGPVGPQMIAMTLAGYLIVYLVLLFAYVSVVFYMARNPGLKEAK
jgi:cytochrome d ubiquinol oxidase subunit I